MSPRVLSVAGESGIELQAAVHQPQTGLAVPFLVQQHPEEMQRIRLMRRPLQNVPV